MSEDTRKLTNVIQIDEAQVRVHLTELVRGSVEETLNGLLDAETDQLVGAKRYERVYEHIEAWRNRAIEARFPYVYLDGLFMKMSFGDGVHQVAVLVAIGVDDDGFREVLGVCQGGKEDKESWLCFLRHLKERGLRSPELCISDACLGLREALGEVFPEAAWQRCIVHFYRNVSTQVPHTKVRETLAMMKAIHAQESRAEAKKKAAFVVERLRQMKLKNAALLVAEGIEDTLSYYAFPPEHWRRIRTNNPLERILREVRRRTQVVGSFPDGHAALMLVAARLRHVSGSK